MLQAADATLESVRSRCEFRCYWSWLLLEWWLTILEMDTTRTWRAGYGHRPVCSSYAVQEYGTSTGTRYSTLMSSRKEGLSEDIAVVLLLAYNHYDVAEYCRTCEVCQKMTRHKTRRAPMIPLLIIEEPFRRIAMDIVSPLPKSCSGKRYISFAIMQWQLH